MPDLLIVNIKGLVQVRDATPSFLRGADMDHLPVLENAFLLIHDGKIARYGPMNQLRSMMAARIVDASGRFVFPSFVDSHTHLVFAASREEEMELKIRGATYEEIAARGGGILNSARRLQAMGEDELFEQTRIRANEIIRSGTGAVEIKSGYGLTLKDELKMLRVARRIAAETPLTVKTTFLGAHAVPQGTAKSDYVRRVMEEMIPAVASERLADYIDVFCEQGFFTPDETERIVMEGIRFGMKPRIHANQLHRSGGVQVGVKVGALSVDHLENIGDEEIELLGASSVMPTALPGAAFFLRLNFPPARRMLDAGLPLALATDFNPGSAPSGSMPFVIALACIQMKMTPAEAINAATINTAYAIELLDTHGSITTGKAANIFISKPMPSVGYFPYRFSSNLVDTVVLGGKIIETLD